MNKANDYYVRSGNAGNLQSAHHLGIMYLKGRNVAQNIDDGIYYLKFAAEHGYQKSIDALAEYGVALNKASNATQ